MMIYSWLIIKCLRCVHVYVGLVSRDWIVLDNINEYIFTIKEFQEMSLRKWKLEEPNIFAVTLSCL